VPETHLTLPQAVLELGKSQAPAPSHLPAQGSVAEPVPMHSPSGSVPDVYGLQVPSLPLSLQEVQAPSQALSQQNPSAQCPLWHSLS